MSASSTSRAWTSRLSPEAIERKYGQAPELSSTPGQTTSSLSVHHHQLLQNLNSALKALGGTSCPDATTPPTSRNRFLGDEDNEVCSRRPVNVPRMPSLDDGPALRSAKKLLDMQQKHASLAHECEILQGNVDVLRREVEELTEQRASMAMAEELLRTLNSELENTTELVDSRKALLDDVTVALEDKKEAMRSLDAKVRELDATMASRQRQLDALEDVAVEGEHLVEDQSRKASAAFKELERLDEELGRLSAELVECDARLAAKKTMLREVTALEARSKDRLKDLEGQKRLLEEIELHNAVALGESKRLAAEISRLERSKREVSFDLQPALEDALTELAMAEHSQATAESLLMEERAKLARIERSLLEERVTVAAGKDELDLLARLEHEGKMARARTTELIESDKFKTWRMWRRTSTSGIRAVFDV